MRAQEAWETVSKSFFSWHEFKCTVDEMSPEQLADHFEKQMGVYEAFRFVEKCYHAAQDRASLEDIACTNEAAAHKLGDVANVLIDRIKGEAAKDAPVKMRRQGDWDF